MQVFGGVAMIIKCYKPIPINGKFECFDVITRVKSLLWNKKFYDIGSFQLSMRTTNLQKNDIITHGTNSGIVMKIEKTLSGCEVYGYDLKGITGFRHIYEAKRYAGNSEVIIKTIAADTLTAGKRTIEGLRIAEERLGINDSAEWLCENVNVAESLKKFCREKDMSFDISFSESGMIFDVSKGRDMTDYIIFSRKNHNIDEMTYTTDNYGTYNVIYSKSQSEGTSEIVETGDATGILRREGATDNAPEAYLKEKQPIETMRGTANNKLKYGVDWINGDYVTCIFDDYITEKQIVEVKEVYEPSRISIIPTFGEEKENPIRKILRG